MLNMLFFSPFLQWVGESVSCSVFLFVDCIYRNSLCMCMSLKIISVGMIAQKQIALVQFAWAQDVCWQRNPCCYQIISKVHVLALACKIIRSHRSCTSCRLLIHSVIVYNGWICYTWQDIGFPINILVTVSGLM